MSQVVFAEEEVTVHQTMAETPDKDQTGKDVWPVTSKVLLPGDSVELDSLPPYQQEAVKSGKVPGLTLKSKDEAKRLGAEAAASRAGAPAGAVAVEQRVASHSDWLVPDTERAANHAALAEEEAEAGVASDDDANPLVGHAKALAGTAPVVSDVESGKDAGVEDTGQNDSAKLAKAGTGEKDEKK